MAISIARLFRWQARGQCSLPAKCRIRCTILLMLGLSLLAGAQTASQRPKRPHNPNAIEALTIVIRPEGFWPPAMRIPFGHYALGVYNRSGLHDLELELDRMPGNGGAGQAEARIASGIAQKRTARWTKHVQFAPGSYRLRVASRPAWACRIEVQ